MSAKDSITTQTCELSQGEFNDFLSLYPIPFEYHFILPKSNQTIFDAPLGYVGLYTHSFSLANLRLPLTEFFCELLVVSPQSTFSEGSLIFVELYSQLLSDKNKLDSKSFKDKLPPNIKENPMFQGLGRYPTSVRVFPDPILFLAGLKSSCEHGQQRPVILVGDKEMAFRNFIYTEDDEDLSFLPKEPSLDFGIGDSGGSPKPELFVVHPRSVAARIKDRKCKTRGGSSRPPIKRKLASGSSTSHATCAKTSSSKDDAPFLIVSDDDEGLPNVLELKDVIACYLKISAITLPTWKNHLDNHIDLELLDLHDYYYARQAVVDNAVNRRERAREEECEGLRVKCEAAMTEFEKNPTVVALREKISVLSAEVKEHKLNLDRMMLEDVEVSLRKEVEELKQDRREVVSKVIPYAAMELVHIDEMGSLVGKLLSSAIVYGRCKAFKQVADMKEPFDLSKDI
ncbi:hypothetical protein Tco_0800472 [Tanacetum coccineum]|uniref:Transposase (Putative), gypsy type n=1 Tax=Tanacetum coccineum TaxID=301880 RepID=A0ABQ4ZTA3_9ASTR